MEMHLAPTRLSFVMLLWVYKPGKPLFVEISSLNYWG